MWFTQALASAMRCGQASWASACPVVWGCGGPPAGGAAVHAASAARHSDPAILCMPDLLIMHRPSESSTPAPEHLISGTLIWLVTFASLAPYGTDRSHEAQTCSR